MQYENKNVIRIDWHLTNRCNFRCEYCHPQIKRVLDTGPSEPSISKIVTAFDNLSDECDILMSGGEPFAFPMFADLCKELSVKHKIRINTNLTFSEEIIKFCNAVQPERVIEIIAAIHISERERLNFSLKKYIDNYLFLLKNGFPIHGLYVLYPPLLSRAKVDIDALKDHGLLDIRAKVFKGVYMGRRYPDSYSDDERDLIKELSGKYLNNENYLNGNLSFKDESCNSGLASIKVNIDGSVQRCATVRIPLGNLFDGTFIRPTNPLPCTANRVLALSECKQLLVQGITLDSKL